MSLVLASAHLGAVSWWSALLGSRCILSAGQALHGKCISEGGGRAAPDDNRMLAHRLSNTCHQAPFLEP